MSIEKVREYFREFGIEDKILELNDSSATVLLAAEALGCEPARIAKTLAFKNNEECILIVAAGDAKVDNHKFKETFGIKAKMPSGDEVETLSGHAIGGVCPFANNECAKVFLDISLKRFETIFPACGSSNSAIELHLDELEKYSKYVSYVDVCKDWH